MALITEVSPYRVQYRGGTEITVTGSGLAGASELYFRDMNGKRVDVADFTVHSDSKITFIGPAAPVGGKYDLYIVVNGKVATNPLENQTVWDGDRLSATGTAGATTVKVQNDANRVLMV